MNPQNRAKFSQALLLLGLVAVAAALVGTESFLSQRNTLYFNGRWTSTKTGLARGVVGAVAFVTTRTALSGDHLDLGSWHGLNEVTYNRHDLHPTRIDFDFHLDGHAFLIFEYNRAADGFSGIRISQSSHFGNLLLTTSADGGFISKTPLPKVKLSTGWNHLRANFASDKVAFFLNGEAFAEDPHPPLASQWIGFKSSTDPTWVDGIAVRQKTPPYVIHESFRNTHHYFVVFLCVFVLIFALGALPAVIFKGRMTGVFAGILVEFLILGCLSAFYVADYYHFSRQYPQSATQIDRWLRYVGTTKFRDNMDGDINIVHEIMSGYAPREKGVYRIFFIGSSQTWGAGAYNKDDVFAHRIEVALNANPSLRRRYGRFECIDPAHSGDRLQDQWVQFFHRLKNLNPKMVVINMSNNDQNTPEFEHYLKSFERYDRENGIKTVYVLEPNYIEAHFQNVADNHAVMRKLGSEYRVPVVDLQSYMDEHADDGLEFWDDVHMTSYGQRLAGDLIYRSISEILTRN